jgi:hypothetical protein
MKKTFLAFLVLIQILVIAPVGVYAQQQDDEPDIHEEEQPGWGGASQGQINTQSQPVFIPGMIGVQQGQTINTLDSDQAGQDGVDRGNEGALTSNSCSSIKFKTVIDILIWLKCIAVAVLIPLIFAAAFVVFLWGMLKFMYANESKKREEAKKLVWWGLIGLFVMVSVWGIIKIVGTTLGIDPIAVPLLDTTYLDVNKASR